jgi:uncharacterized protein (DUF433 family)
MESELVEHGGSRVAANTVDLLQRPVYGFGQVDDVLGLRGGTARRWIDGYERRGRPYPPVVRAEPTGDEVVTWGEFTETRLLAEFRNAGVPMVRLRPAVVRLREVFETPYPLALASPYIDVRGRELVMEVQEETGLERALQLVVVRNDQLLLSESASRFVASADFGVDSKIVERIRPWSELDRVWLDPLRQFGVPAVRSVPTAVIAEQFRAGDPIDFIAHAYELADEDVAQALRYELHKIEAAQAA